MKKQALLVVIAIVVIAAVYWPLSQRDKSDTQISGETVSQIFDSKNSTFTIDGDRIELLNGTAQTDTGVSSPAVTRYFGNEDTGDLNGDGIDDVAFIISRQTGGTGLFYYAVVAASSPKGYVTTNPFYIGDRIAPQWTQITDSRELHIYYADRNPGEPMSTLPSAGKVLLLKVSSTGVLEGLMK